MSIVGWIAVVAWLGMGLRHGVLFLLIQDPICGKYPQRVQVIFWGLMFSSMFLVVVIFWPVYEQVLRRAEWSEHVFTRSHCKELEERLEQEMKRNKP